MNAGWRPRIIAVFGSSKKVPDEVLRLARCAGSEAATQGFIVLTGGTMEAQEPVKVKNAALKGVEDAVSKGSASDGNWIGVLQEGNRPGSKRDGNCADFKSEGNSCVIYSDMGNQRNFLEACLCDAAIVLGGAEGTISEAVSTLCLGKPVLLCGRTPVRHRSATYQLPEEQEALFNARKALYELFESQSLTEDQESYLVMVALHRLKEEHENRAMRDRIEEDVRRGKVRFPEHGHLITASGPEACQDIAGWLAQLANLSRTGGFPGDLGGKYNAVKNAYNTWLSSLLRPAE